MDLRHNDSMLEVLYRWWGKEGATCGRIERLRGDDACGVGGRSTEEVDSSSSGKDDEEGSPSSSKRSALVRDRSSCSLVWCEEVELLWGNLLDLGGVGGVGLCVAVSERISGLGDRRVMGVSPVFFQYWENTDRLGEVCLVVVAAACSCR